MPDPVVHASFGREVLASLPDGIRDFIVPEPYQFALFGPDVWFLYKPFGHKESRGRRMHTTKCGLFLMSLLRQASVSSARAEMFSYLAGFCCHYALDSTTHPYIIHVTAEEHVFPRSHMSLEHALDAAVMRRDGVWGTAHPVTDRYFPRLRLPDNMRADLDAVYQQVYGWTGCQDDMNRSFLRYRLCFRLMENPKGFGARLARLTQKPVLLSLCYSESFFHSRDPENENHRQWHNPFDPSLCSSESFTDLREKARQFAVKLITAAWRFTVRGEGTEEELAALIGDRSYLSGFPSDDPRNLTVESMLPPDVPAGKGAP
jgi:hypothetical protein